LGTVGILRIIVSLDLANNLLGLILVYIAQGLPLTIFILTNFMRQVPMELKDAARIDGASEYRIFRMVLPLVRPAIGAIGIFTMIPIWNDLWFPLILAPSESTATVTLGVQQFLGQFVRWNAVSIAHAGDDPGVGFWRGLSHPDCSRGGTAGRGPSEEHTPRQRYTWVHAVPQGAGASSIGAGRSSAEIPQQPCSFRMTVTRGG
jgi:hypothetical protein